MAEQFSLDQFLAQSQSVFSTERVLEPADTDVGIDVIDQVDGKFVVRSKAHLNVSEDMRFSSDVKRGQGLEIEITQGRANIEQDPYTGLTLITPKGSTPVRARPVLDAKYRENSVTLVGEEKSIGFDTKNIPTEQSTVQKAGGGACNASWEVGQKIDFDVQVRASIMANIIPKTEEQRDIRWQNGLYFAHDEKIGFMRLSYNPERESSLVMSSKTSRESIKAESFFPSTGKNEIYFIVEFLDLGYVGFNKVPMVQNIDNIVWPPFSDEVLTIESPLAFYDMNNPDQVLMTLRSQEMYLYDYNSIEVECLEQKISNDGIFQSRWRIVNQTREIIQARWFTLGSYSLLANSPDQGNRLLGPSGSGLDSYEFDFIAGLQKSSLTQSISMNVVSLKQPIVSGAYRIDFKYPSE
jgi:hypothetical protein